MLKKLASLYFFTAFSINCFAVNNHNVNIQNNTGHAITVTSAIRSPLCFSGAQVRISIPPSRSIICKLTRKQKEFIEDAKYSHTPTTRTFSIPAKDGTKKTRSIEYPLGKPHGSSIPRIVLTLAKPGDAKAGDKIILC